MSWEIMKENHSRGLSPFLILACIASLSTAQFVQRFPWLPLYTHDDPQISTSGSSDPFPEHQSCLSNCQRNTSIWGLHGHLKLAMSETDLITFPLNWPILHSFFFFFGNINGHITYLYTQGVLLDSFLCSTPPSVFNRLLSTPVLHPKYLPNQTSFTDPLSHCFISGLN